MVLPFGEAEFIDTSVRRGGDVWIGKFKRCLDRASSVTYATNSSYLGDRELFAYGSSFAMGMAMLRARAYELDCLQIAVSDEVEQNAPPIAGTIANRNLWQRNNPGKRDIICIHALDTADELSCEPNNLPYSSTVDAGQGSGRKVKAILFGDIKGFSHLDEDQLPTFWDIVIPMFSKVVEHFDPSALGNADLNYVRLAEKKIEFCNTWGDGLFLVINNVANAAELALRLQEAIRDHRHVFDAAGFPKDMAFRLGGHLGPVFEGPDPLLGKNNWYGSAVARAARIEPITPPGEIYVTEPFAAILALESGLDKYSCEYDGEIPTAKGYGNFRMYRLRRGKLASKH